MKSHEDALTNSKVLGGTTMDTNEKMKNLDEDYITAFRNILKEAERMEREAMDRFHSWSGGMMDPAEDEVYSNAVKECAMNLKRDRISA